MAKYIVSRTSIWGEKPVDEAVPCEVHPYRGISGRAAEFYKKKLRKQIDVEWEDEDGSFGGYQKEGEAAWLCDIPDLHEFVNKYGNVILMKPHNKEGYWELEIYDDYRE